MNGARYGTTRRGFLRLMAVGGGALAASRLGSLSGVLAQDGSDVEAHLTTYNWGSAEEAQAYAEAFARFNELYPNVRVTDNITPVTSWADYADKLVAQIAGGNPPDIINIAIEGVQLGVAKGLLLPLDDYIANDAAAQEYIGQIPQALLDAFSVDGVLYEIPNGWQTMVVHYNTKMFADKGIDPPSPEWTWEEFLTLAQELTTGEGADKVYGFGLPWAFFQLHPWWLTNGSYPVTADYAQSNLNDPKFMEAVTFVTSLVNEHKVSPDPLALNVYDQFGAGRLAMVGAGRWPIGGWKAGGFTDYDIVPWPRKETPNTVFGGAGWGISPDSANPDLAWEAIKELISVDTITATMKIGQQIPILESVAEDPAFLEAPQNAKLFFDVAENMRPVAAPPYFSDLERITMRHLESVLIGAVGVEDAMNAAHEELNTAIERFNR